MLCFDDLLKVCTTIMSFVRKNLLRLSLALNVALLVMFNIYSGQNMSHDVTSSEFSRSLNMETTAASMRTGMRDRRPVKDAEGQHLVETTTSNMKMPDQRTIEEVKETIIRSRSPGVFESYFGAESDSNIFEYDYKKRYLIY
mmetsp:Transcript_15014/g.17561  ORF Transcript_15014/g.17561 Transcript_15014/m.17561 type:complete len:142 (+) Transcript_15014:8-433(+)